MPTETSRRSMMSRRNIIIVVVLIIVIAAGALIWQKMHPASQDAQNAALIAQVSKLMIVPNETPIIATINQASVLIQEQAFYAGSENGDKLIIFPNAKKAIIYSPSRNIIVNAGPFVINQGAAGTGTTPASGTTTQ